MPANDAAVRTYDYPVDVIKDGRTVGQIEAHRVKLPIENATLKPTFRLDFNTARFPDGRIFTAAAPGFLFVSEDDGLTWREHPVPDLVRGSGHGSDKWQGRRIRGFGGAGQTLLMLLADEQPDPTTYTVFRSSDGAETWKGSAPLDHAPFDNAGADASAFCPLPDGTILTTIQLSYTGWNQDPDALPEADRGPRSFVYRSSDDGRSWQKGSEIGEHTCETQLLCKQDGSLLAIVRRQGHALPDAHNKTLFVADSDDQGHTWTNLRQVCSEVGCCHGEAVQLSDGRIVILHDKRYPYPQGAVHAILSADGGTTWQPEVYVVVKGHGYSGSIVLDDDTIVTVSGDEFQDDKAQIGPQGHTAQTLRWRIP